MEPTVMDFPSASLNLGKPDDVFFVRKPNFININTQEYHPDYYQEEVDDVKNTIRWRRGDDPDHCESNARIVEWSDGSKSLYLGSEIFDINEKVMGETAHLYVRMGLRQGLQAQSIFTKKLSIRPNSTESFTHRKLTLSLADRSQKTQKIRMLSNPGEDPEARLGVLIKQEDDKQKASMRRETKKRRIQERSQVGGPSASYLEPDYEEEDEDGAISLSDIKRGAMARTYDSDESSEDNEQYSDDSDPEFGKIKRRSDRKQKQVVDESDED